MIPVQFSRYSRIIGRSGNIVFSRLYSSKSTQAQKLQHYYLENKVIYGPPLKEKNKKSKSKPSTSVPSIQSKAENNVIPKQATHASEDFNSNSSEKKSKKKTETKQSVIKQATCASEDLNSNSSEKKSKKKTETKQSVPKQATHASEDLNQSVPDNHFINAETNLPVFDFIRNFSIQGNTNDENIDFKSAVEDMGLRSLPPVSAILNYTQSEQSRFYLERWRKTSIAELGLDGFNERMKAIINDGINLHANIQQFLSGNIEDIQIQPRVEGYWNSLQSALQKIDDVVALESSFIHPNLLYKGKFDCVAKFGGDLCLIDWKTSQKPKPLVSNLFDHPLQVVAYLGGVCAGTQITTDHGPISAAVVVVCYPWGEPAHIHRLTLPRCENYWKKWLERLHQYWTSMAREKGLEKV